jgi:drug/metabolite transporter (DMT)-like permease
VAHDRGPDLTMARPPPPGAARAALGDGTSGADASIKPSARAHDDHRAATLCALGAAFVLPCVDAMVKWLVADYPIVMVAWARMGLIAIVLGAIGGSQIGWRMVRPLAWRLQLLRGAAAVLGTVMVFLGFRAMPLAECLAIVSIAPVLANVFSSLWLGERGDAFSWAMALASFAGVLVIARPGFGVFALDAIYPLVGAVGLAGFLTLTRAVSGRDDPRVTAFFGPFVAFVLFSFAMPVNWVAPKSAAHVALFVGAGVLAAAAQVLQTLAYRHGSTHRIAPFSYAALVISIGVGWLVFRAVPDAASLLGMSIIAAAGVAMVLRR